MENQDEPKAAREGHALIPEKEMERVMKEAEAKIEAGTRVPETPKKKSLGARVKEFVFELDTLTVGLVLLGVGTLVTPLGMAIMWLAGAWIWQAKAWNLGAAMLATAYRKVGQEKAALGVLAWARWMTEKREK